MRNAGKLFWLTIFVMTFAVGSVVNIFALGRTPQTLNLPDDRANVVDDDDDVPEVTARVARISFIRGDVQIRRVDGTDWEKATLNLPIVEGDELSTSADARVEIQFNNFSHLRLDQNAFLKISVLKNEGVAFSLSQGTMSLRVTDLDKAAGYFEVDAPKTTLAVQKSGSYRIDAGKAGDADIFLSVTNGGEARVYSDSAGFTLKSGRGARVFVEGNNAGEWETADAAKNADEFDSWTADRDAMIAQRIKDAYYDKYYDQDIYGADDLDAYGEWIHTSQYGYVWRPYRNSISVYADWSPYRYGHWRWVPPYGWTWVNDEPWGWATYHHGRWVYDNGYWVWTPYGYYRPSHSWWFPALVVINIINDNVCWYPLQYHRRYTAYNDHRDRDRDNRGGGGQRPGGNGNRPSGIMMPAPSPTPMRIDRGGQSGGIRPPAQPTGIMADAPVPTPISIDRMPNTGVVSVSTKDFGTRTGGVRMATPDIAKEAISLAPTRDRAPDLPDHTQVNRRKGGDILTSQPTSEEISRRVKVGAADRRTDAPLDKELRNTRIFGGRPPAKTGNDAGSTPVINDNGPREPRKTGAVDRPPVKTDDAPTRRPPVMDSPGREANDPRETPTRRPPVTDSPGREVKVPDDSAPTRQPPRREPPRREETPKTDPPPTRQTRVDPVQQREVKPPSEAPKPAPKTDTPKTETPKPQPKNDPPPKVDRPEQKNRKDGVGEVSISD